MQLGLITNKYDMTILEILLINKGYSINTIKDLTGLSRDTIEKSIRFWRDQSVIYKNRNDDRWFTNDCDIVKGFNLIKSSEKFIPEQVPEKVKEGVYIEAKVDGLVGLYNRNAF